MRFVTLLCCVLAIPHSAWGAYRLTDLGSLGGTSGVDGTSSASALTDDGVVVGETQIGFFNTHAFIWDEVNGMASLGTLGGSGDSFAYDINDNREVVGTSNSLPFRWSPHDGIVNIDPTPGSANGINESGTVAITRPLPNDSERVVIRTPDRQLTLPYPFTPIRAVAINDNGEFVGCFTNSDHGFISDGSALFVTNPGMVPEDVNHNRQISGAQGLVSAIWDFNAGVTTMLGHLNPSDTRSRGLGINNAGLVVGESVGTGAFLYNPATSTLVNLTAELAPQFAGWTVTVANDINENGWIVGDGVLNGVKHAVLLRPIISGDFDGDGVVDATDLEAWSDSFGVDARGDADGDGVTDGADFLSWQRSITQSVIAVPEPHLMTLGASLILIWGLARGSRRIL